MASGTLKKWNENYIREKLILNIIHQENVTVGN